MSDLKSVLEEWNQDDHRNLRDFLTKILPDTQDKSETIELIVEQTPKIREMLDRRV